MSFSNAVYQFFDADFVLESDQDAFLESFARAYHRFQIQPGEGQLPVYRVLLTTDEPSLEMEGQRFIGRDAAMLSHFSYNQILNTACARVRSHILFHGAALSTPDGRGVILAGPSGIGKTTLTQALVQRGFGFLSDEVAAIDRLDGRLHPFPRSLGLSGPGMRPTEKQFVDVEDLLQVSPGAPCPISFLFLLSGHDGGSTSSAAPIDGPSGYILTDVVVDAWLQAIRALDGILSLQAEPDALIPITRFRLTDESVFAGLEAQIIAVCRTFRILPLEIGMGQPPDEKAQANFNRRPELVPLSPSQAVRELLNHLRNGPRSNLLLQEFGGNSLQLYMHLVKLFAQVQCFRLSTGSLEERIDLVIRAGERT
jgi:hypothetical protein